jgi:hypothetical protein
MSKVKDNKQHYLFYKETGESTDCYDENGFSKYISSCLKQIFNKTGLNVSTLRHTFQTWFAQNITLFNEVQQEEVAVDVGDKFLATMKKYVVTPVENRDKPVSQIIDEIDAVRNDIKQLENAVMAEEEGSVGQAASYEEIDEFNSPVRVNEPSATSKEQMFKRLGEIELEKAMLLKLLMG